MPAPLPDETVAGTRGITTEIEKNRGLTPHRWVMAPGLSCWGRRAVANLGRVPLRQWRSAISPAQNQHCCDVPAAHNRAWRLECATVACQSYHLLVCVAFLCRRKDLKNPRKKHRLAFQKAQVRRKGAVQDVREPTSTYGGEATGVKARVVKSRRLG